MRLLALAVCLLMAGCASPAPNAKLADDGTDGTNSIEEALDSVEVTVGATTGCIRGVVVDEAIRPIQNVTIKVMPGNYTLHADSRGLFVQCALKPAAYFLTIESYGYATQQTSTDVKAGETATVRVSLPALYSTKPYHDTIQFRGFIEVGAWVGTFALGLVADEFLNTTTCECYFEYTASEDVVQFTLEAQWVDNIPNPAGPADKYWQVQPPENITLDSIKSGYSTSPVHVQLARSLWAPADDHLQIGLTEGTMGEYQQSYDLFFTVWHVAPPPSEEWSFIAGDV